jgi:segregation and condensation protein A
MPELSLHDLQLAWLRLMKRARLVQHHRVEREKLSVREHMTLILRKLSGGAFVVFDTLFDLEKGPAGLVVSFIAMLELVKESLVVVVQNEAFAPIYVKLADGEH